MLSFWCYIFFLYIPWVVCIFPVCNIFLHCFFSELQSNLFFKSSYVYIIEYIESRYYSRRFYQDVCFVVVVSFPTYTTCHTNTCDTIFKFYFLYMITVILKRKFDWIYSCCCCAKQLLHAFFNVWNISKIKLAHRLPKTDFNLPNWISTSLDFLNYNLFKHRTNFNVLKFYSTIHSVVFIHV